MDGPVSRIMEKFVDVPFTVVVDVFLVCDDLFVSLFLHEALFEGNLSSLALWPIRFGMRGCRTLPTTIPNKTRRFCSIAPPHNHKHRASPFLHWERNGIMSDWLCTH